MNLFDPIQQQVRFDTVRYAITFLPQFFFFGPSCCLAQILIGNRIYGVTSRGFTAHIAGHTKFRAKLRSGSDVFAFEKKKK